MNLNQMYYYVTVCDCKGFSKAAEQIFVSQPTLSKQVAALEAELGLRLIDRKTRGIFALTDEGERYLQTFRRILREFEETNVFIKRSQTGKRRIYRVGLMESWLLHDLARTCRAAIEARFPEVELRFLFLRPREMTRLRAEGKLDMALLRDDVNWPDIGCCWEKLRDIQGVLYVSAKNPYITNGQLQVLKLQKEPLYAPAADEVMDAKGHPVFHLMGGRDLRVVECESLATMHRGVLSSRGYGFADEWSDVAFSPHFHVHPLPEMRRGVVLSWQEEDRSDLTQILADCVRDWVQAPCFEL